MLRAALARSAWTHPQCRRRPADGGLALRL